MTVNVTFTATFDHRTGVTVAGGPASRYHRVARCDGRSSARPNFAARRVAALLVALASVMTGAWFVGEIATAVAGRPASAADAGASASSSDDRNDITPRAHVARSGDTLWSIADEYRGSVNRDRYIDALVDLNGSTSIDIGQAVRLP